MKELGIPESLSTFTKPDHPVLLISGRAGEEVNVMPAGWVTRVSLTPPMMLVSVGFERHTHELMKKYDEFILSYPSPGMEKVISFCGACSGRDTDKLKSLEIRTRPAFKVRLPLIEGCRAGFECVKKGECVSGDHTVFTGEVIAASGDPELPALINTGNYNYREFRP